MNKTYVASLLMFTLIALSLQGQDVHFSSINANDMYLNPAKTAFTSTDFKVATAYRNQRQTVSTNGHNTTLFTAEARLLSSKKYRHSLGLGLGFVSDVAGTLNFGQRQMFVNLSYNKQIEKRNNHFISIGVQLSNTYWSYDMTNADFGPQQSDWEGILLSDLSYNDVSLGIHWQIEPVDFQAISAGFAVFHLTQPGLTFMDELNIGQLRLKPRYYGYVNYLFPTSDASKIQLSASTSIQNDNYEILIGGDYIIDMSNTIFDQTMQ